MAKFVLHLSAIVFGGVGVAFLVAPVPLISPVGIVLKTSGAVTDIRAIYGGVALGFGAYLLLCARRQKWEEGLTASLLTLAGLVLARVVGITLDGNPGPIVGGTAASEVVGLVLSIAALKSVRNRPTASA